MLAALLGALVFLALMAGLFVPLEWLWPKQARRLEWKGLGVASALFVVNTLLMEAIGGPLLDWLSRTSSPVTLARVGASFVLSDLAGYWIHRTMHRLPWLWRFHRVHHEAVELSWFDAWRQHPIDFVLHGVIVGLPGALMGVSLSSIASIVVLRKAYTTFLHANVPVDFGWFLASPAFHAVHHGADPRDFDTNFAGTFPVWDLIFGTAQSALTTKRLPRQSA